MTERIGMQAAPLAPLAVGLDDAARLVGLSRFTLRRRIRAGQLRALRVGNRYIISMSELKRFVNGGPCVPPHTPKEGDS